MDNCSYTDNSMAAGVGEQLHDWRIYSYSSGYRNRCDPDQNHSGTQTFVAFRVTNQYRGRQKGGVK